MSAETNCPDDWCPTCGQTAEPPNWTCGCKARDDVLSRPAPIELERRLQKLREERDRIEKRVWEDQQRMRVVYEAIAAEVTALAEGR